MEKLRDGKIDLRQPRLFTDRSSARYMNNSPAVAITNSPARSMALSHRRG
jgi:hypothetical protein